MPSLLRSPLWLNPTLVPTVPAGADANHPLFADRIYLPGKSYGDLLGRDGPGTGLPTLPKPAAGVRGAGGYFDPAAVNGIKVDGPFLGGLGAWTVVALVQGTRAPNSGGAIIYNERGTSGNDLLSLNMANGYGATAAVVYRNDGGTLSNPTGTLSPAINDGLPHVCVGLFTGSTLTSYVDGVPAITNSWSSNNNFTNSTVYHSIGTYSGAPTSSSWSQFIYSVMLFRRALTPDQVAWISNEPFVMLRPIQPRRTWSVPSGAVYTRPRVMLIA